MKTNRKLFALSPGKIISPLHRTASNSRMPPNLTGQLKQLDSMIEAISPGYKQAAAQSAIDKITNAGQNNAIRWKNDVRTPAPAAPPQVGPGATVFKSSKPIADTNISYALSKAPNPKQINLNSGIKPNTYSNDYMLPVENGCSPLHTTLCTLRVPTSATNPLNSYFLNTIAFDIQTRAQANIGFSLDIATTLTSANILASYNAVIYALQVYFYYSSILSYESNPHNKNSGMIALRATIDATALSDLMQLGRRLEDTPMPPRLVEWVRYMNGNFLSGNSQGSPILKIIPDFSCITSLVANPTLCQQALTGLNTYTTQFALIRKAIPNWKVKVLYDCDPLPVYDKNFCTIFSNLPVIARNSGNTAAVRPNTVIDFNTGSPYNTFTNRLDGLAFAMGGMYASTTGDWVPGIVIPNAPTATYIDNRLSYYSVSGVKGFYYVSSYPFLQRSRQETNQYDGTTVIQPHLYATDKCQNVTGSAFFQTSQNSLDYLFNIDTIPYRGAISHFNNTSKGKI